MRTRLNDGPKSELRADSAGQQSEISRAERANSADDNPAPLLFANAIFTSPQKINIFCAIENAEIHFHQHD